MSAGAPLTVIFPLSAALSLTALFFAARALRRRRAREEETKRELLQSSVLAQIASRISYTLDADQIVEVIAGSIDPLLPYATVGFIVRDAEARTLRTHLRLREPVAQAFADSVRATLSAAFEALCGDDCREYRRQEVLLGETREAAAQKVGSYFNLPIVFDGRAVALINVSSPDTGLYTEERTAILYRITGLAAEAVSRLRKVIRDEQRRMDAMVSSLPSGLFMVDQEERVVTINAQLRSMLGFAAGENPHLSDLLEKTRKTLGLHELMRASQTERKTVTSEDVRLNDRVLRVTVSPVVAVDGVDLGTVASFEDVTAQKELESLKEQFTAMLVHELRSPLTALRWQIEGFGDEPRISKQERHELGQDMMAVVNRLLSLVNDLLDAAKIEAGKFSVHPVAGDLGAVIRESAALFAPTAEAKKLSLKTEIDALPAVVFDADRIRQVMANFLSNAVKFTVEGGIRVSARANGGFLRVEIADTGPGVEPADRPKLFRRFEQLSRGGLKEAGTGLGLVIVKGIIEAHGGAVGFEPREPHGSAFWFELPLAATPT